jgi:hypothetical protein
MGICAMKTKKCREASIHGLEGFENYAVGIAGNGMSGNGFNGNGFAGNGFGGNGINEIFEIDFNELLKEIEKGV